MNIITKANKMLEKLGLDGFIVTNSSNRRYLTNFTGSNGIFLLSNKGNLIITDYRYEEQAQIQTDNIDIVLHEDHTGHKGSKSTIYKKVIEQICRLNLRKVGFEKDSIIYGLYDLLNNQKEFELIPTLDFIEDLRMIKTPEEINKLKKATEVVDKAFEYIIDFIKPGLTELEVAEEITDFIKKQNATNSGFLPIVASGYRSALAHGRASEKVIEEGDMVVVDFGANIESYWSDMTRTFAIGQPDQELEHIYYIILEALEKSLHALKPGIYDCEIDKQIKKHINAKGFGKYAGTGTGHGLGIDVHENPFISTKKDKKLAENMVLAIEPGIYLPNKGGVRIEDNVLITSDGYENWSKTTKDLLIL